MGAEKDTEGFVPLFNGEDLSGWVNVACGPKTWTVKDGMIHCDGKPTGALRTEKQYENFILELEWRHLKSGGNAGLFVWAEPISAPGVPFLRAVEVQILDHGYGNTKSYTTHGDVFPIHGSTMQPFPPNRGQRSFPSERRSKPSPEWNHYRVVCKEGEIRLSVNGKEVSGGKNCNYRKGYIALESEGGVVDYRNIRLKELPSSNAPKEVTAPVAEGHVALYNGVDLTGWRTNDAKLWKPSDWVLRCEGANARIETEKAFGNFELVFDIKRRGDGEAMPGLAVGNGPPVVLPLGKGWKRFRLTATKERCALYDGKKQLREWKRPVGDVRIAWGVPEGKVDFANFFIREMK